MARPKEENSVRTLVGLLESGSHVNISGKSLSSVAVMTSQLKRNEEHKDKKFKVSFKEGIVTVKRVL